MGVVHWHAFAWDGYERPPDSERIVPANPTPPLEIAHWLRKQKRHVAETFTEADDAHEWMWRHLDKWPEAQPIPRESRDAFIRDCLARGSDVVYGFYPAKIRYVSLALVYCPRPGEPCPDPPGRA
ncbi:hypothetical protein GA0115243_102544 [Streptomyces sp. ScaeMP-e83]|nr:hypothetical protein GA0115243_102544 [Streptomyces sp. ScaeMP-e83]